MSDRADTYSVDCNCGTCQMLRDSMAPSCRGCRIRHDEVAALTARVDELETIIGVAQNLNPVLMDVLIEKYSTSTAATKEPECEHENGLTDEGICNDCGQSV